MPSDLAGRRIVAPDAVLIPGAYRLHPAVAVEIAERGPGGRTQIQGIPPDQRSIRADQPRHGPAVRRKEDASPAVILEIACDRQPPVDRPGRHTLPGSIFRDDILAGAPFQDIKDAGMERRDIIQTIVIIVGNRKWRTTNSALANLPVPAPAFVAVYA